ncbi:MAG: hypothetical protein QXJ95_00575 [Ignisphaera sp.]|uniref:Uncharacterized protein n=1 Tax=Ignisphaera aggregans TaxID=334771 RepID=A0A7J3JNR2_9CREN
MVVKKIAVLQNIKYRECNGIINRIIDGDVDIIVICGGIRECRNVIDVPKNVFGIVDLEDDVHIIKLMKNRNVYIAGKWKLLEDGICIGGIDAKNPVQNLLMIIEELPYGCKNLVLVSRYPIIGLDCSSIEIFKKKISIGFTTSLIEKLLNRIEKMVFICCNNTLDGVCTGTPINDRFVNVSLIGHFTKITIDFTNIRKIAIEY